MLSLPHSASMESLPLNMLVAPGRKDTDRILIFSELLILISQPARVIPLPGAVCPAMVRFLILPNLRAPCSSIVPDTLKIIVRPSSGVDTIPYRRDPWIGSSFIAIVFQVDNDVYVTSPTTTGVGASAFCTGKSNDGYTIETDFIRPSCPVPQARTQLNVNAIEILKITAKTLLNPLSLLFHLFAA